MVHVLWACACVAWCVAGFYIGYRRGKAEMSDSAAEGLVRMLKDHPQRHELMAKFTAPPER